MANPKPAPREPTKILYETEFHGKGLAIGVDSFNWIIIHYKKGDDPAYSYNRKYFISLPKMLMALQGYLVKERIKRLDTSEVIRVVEQAYEDVEKLGQGLVLNIVNQDEFESLPRFPCDHMLGIASSEKQSHGD